MVNLTESIPNAECVFLPQLHLAHGKLVILFYSNCFKYFLGNKAGGSHWKTPNLFALDFKTDQITKVCDDSGGPQDLVPGIYPVDGSKRFTFGSHEQDLIFSSFCKTQKSVVFLDSNNRLCKAAKEKSWVCTDSFGKYLIALSSFKNSTPELVIRGIVIHFCRMLVQKRTMIRMNGVRSH